MPNAGFETGKITEQEARRFRKIYPWINIKYSIIPWSKVWGRLMDVVKGRQIIDLPDPDVVQLGNTWITTMVYLDALLEIPEKPKNDFIPQLLNCGLVNKVNLRQPHKANNRQISGRLYAIPWFTDLRVLFYRKDIFRQVGLTIRDLHNFNSFRDVCSRLKSVKGIFPLALSGQKETILLYDICPWVWGNGGDFFSTDLKNVRLLDEKTFSGFKFYLDLIDDGYVPLQGREVQNIPGGFFNGSCAMQFSGTWPIKTFFYPSHPEYQADVAKNFGVAPFPKGEIARATYIGGSHLAIIKSTKFPEECLKWIKFLTSPSSEKRYVMQAGMLPSIKEIWHDFFPGQKEAEEVFNISLTFARTLPTNLIASASVDQAFSYFTDKMLGLLRRREYTEQNLRENLEALTEEINYILSISSI